MNVENGYQYFIKLVVPQDISRQTHISRLFSNSIFLILNTIVGAALGFFFWAVAARISSPEWVGISSALVSASGLLSFFGSLGLGYGLIRFLSVSKTAIRLINTCFTFTGIATATLAILFVSTVSLWNPSLSFLSQNISYSVIFVILVIVIACLGLVHQIFVGFRRTEFSVFQTTVFGLTKIGIVFIMISLLPALGIFASWGIGATVAICVSLFFLLPRLQPGYRPYPDFDRQIGKEVFHFSLVNFIAEGFWNIPNWLLPLIIAGLLGGEANAYFYVTWSLTGLLFAIPNSISLSLFAEGSYREDTLNLNIRKGFKLAITLIPISVLLILGFGNRLLTLFGEQYVPRGIELLWVLVPAVIPVSINTGYIGTLRVMRKLKEIILLTGLIAIIVIMSSLILIPRYGICGAGFGWLIGHGMACIYTLPKMLVITGKKIRRD